MAASRWFLVFTDTFRSVSSHDRKPRTFSLVSIAVVVFWGVALCDSSIYYTNWQIAKAYARMVFGLAPLSVERYFVKKLPMCFGNDDSRCFMSNGFYGWEDVFCYF